MSDEAVEAVAEPAAAPVESAEPASVESSESVESAEPAEPAEPAESSSSVFDWNGEVDGLKEAEWFSSLDDSLRETVLKGLETKYQNWQRGYSKAFEENATRRKDLDARSESVRQHEIRVQRWMHGDIDPLLEKQAEIESLQEAHSQALEQLKAEYADATDAAKVASEARERIQQFETEAQAREQAVAAQAEAELEQRTDEFETWLGENAPDIMENDDAFYNLCVLCTGGAPLDQAVAMVRAAYPAPEPEPEPVVEPPPEPEPVPQSVSLMNMGTGQSGGTVKTEVSSARDVLDRMRRAAMIAEGGLFEGG
jgi:hypothetical protein